MAYRLLLRVRAIEMIPSGLARGAGSNSIPFILETDVDTVVCVDKTRSPAKKTLRCLAEIAHDLCIPYGLTELNVTDHTVTPKMNEDPF